MHNIWKYRITYTSPRSSTYRNSWLMTTNLSFKNFMRQSSTFVQNSTTVSFLKRIKLSGESSNFHFKYIFLTRWNRLQFSVSSTEAASEQSDSFCCFLPSVSFLWIFFFMLCFVMQITIASKRNEPYRTTVYFSWLLIFMLQIKERQHVSCWIDSCVAQWFFPNYRLEIDIERAASNLLSPMHLYSKIDTNFAVVYSAAFSVRVSPFQRCHSLPVRETDLR